jgi:hypothetical protein
MAERVAELERRLEVLGRAASRNPGNSSMPPSADDLPGRMPPRQRGGREGKKRRQGKQPGAPSSHLAWSENPDETVPLFPQGACACGLDLAGASDLGVAASHQVIDTSLVTATVTQDEEHVVECALRTAAHHGPAGGGRSARDGHLRPQYPGLVRVPHGRAPCPGGTVRGDHRLVVGHPALEPGSCTPCLPGWGLVGAYDGGGDDQRPDQHVRALHRFGGAGHMSGPVPEVPHTCLAGEAPDQRIASRHRSPGLSGGISVPISSGNSSAALP